MTDWQKWCKLCANREIEQSSSDLESTTKFIEIIQKHFSVALPETFNDENNICFKCKEFLITVEQFGERCVRVNTMFDMIISSNENLQIDPNYLQSLRDDAGLDKDDKTMKQELTTAEKGTDTVDLEVKAEDETDNISLRTRRMKKKAKARKKADKSDQNSNIKDEDLEMDAFDYDNDDFENDPSFTMSSDQEAKLFDDNDDYNIITDSELIGLNVSPRRKRRKHQEPEDINFNCPLCCIDLENKRLFDAHMREYHPKDENPFACPKCPKQFPSLTKLKRHESVHLPDHLKLVHPCKFCDKRFSKLVNVQAHVRAIHTGERSFVCEECGKSFVAKGALKEHQITHSNEYPFQCAHCPKKFKNTARLRTHEDIHKHTAYICPHCGLQLNTKRTLKMHMVVHSDQKKYKCQYCGNEYKRSKALKNHLILHTGLRPYVCPFCEKTFANGSNCRSHKKKAHPVELAALEASGEVLPAANIPKLEHLQPKKPIEENNIVIITQTDDKIIENIVYT